MVLDKDSSILGYPGEVSHPLDANHHDVCKYTNPQDPNYVSVRSILITLISNHHESRRYFLVLFLLFVFDIFLAECS